MRERPFLCASGLLLLGAAGPAEDAQQPGPNGFLGSVAQRSGPSFVENRGQWDERIRFVWRSGDTVLHVEADGLRLARRRVPDERVEGFVLRLGFEDCAPEALIVGAQPSEATRNYLLGNDPVGWRTGVRGFAEVLYHDLYPGIDLRTG